MSTYGALVMNGVAKIAPIVGYSSAHSKADSAIAREV